MDIKPIQLRHNPYNKTNSFNFLLLIPTLPFLLPPYHMQTKPSILLYNKFMQIVIRWNVDKLAMLSNSTKLIEQ